MMRLASGTVRRSALTIGVTVTAIGCVGLALYVSTTGDLLAAVVSYATVAWLRWLTPGTTDRWFGVAAAGVMLLVLWSMWEARPVERVDPVVQLAPIVVPAPEALERVACLEIGDPVRLACASQAGCVCL